MIRLTSQSHKLNFRRRQYRYLTHKMSTTSLQSALFFTSIIMVSRNLNQSLSETSSQILGSPLTYQIKQFWKYRWKIIFLEAGYIICKMRTYRKRSLMFSLIPPPRNDFTGIQEEKNKPAGILHSSEAQSIDSWFSVHQPFPICPPSKYFKTEALQCLSLLMRINITKII